MSKIAESVENLIKPYAEELGLEIVEVEFAKKVNGNNLTVFIDKVGGVTIEDCETLHRAIDEPLDELDPTNGVNYILNVSSCGLDRPLKNLKDYLRNIGKLVQVKLYKPLELEYNGKLCNLKAIQGTILTADENTLTILDNTQKEIKFDKSLIGAVTPVIEF